MNFQSLQFRDDFHDPVQWTNDLLAVVKGSFVWGAFYILIKMLPLSQFVA